MITSGQLKIGFAGFATGILCGWIGLATWERCAGGGAGQGLPEQSVADRGEVRRERLRAGIAKQDPGVRVMFDGLTNDLPAAQRERIRQSLAPLLSELSAIGVGEYCYSSLATLAISEAAREDPEGVFLHVLTKGSAAVRQQYYAAIFNEWVRKDVHAAEKAVADLPPGACKEVLNEVLFQAIQSQNPARACELLKEMKSRSPGDYYKVFKNLAKEGVAIAMERVTAITNDERRAKAVSGIAATYAESQPEEAWRWAQGLEGAARDNALTTVLFSRLNKDLPAALEAIKAIESPELMGRLVAGNGVNENHLRVGHGAGRNARAPCRPALSNWNFSAQNLPACMLSRWRRKRRESSAPRRTSPPPPWRGASPRTPGGLKPALHFESSGGSKNLPVAVSPCILPNCHPHYPMIPSLRQSSTTRRDTKQPVVAIPLGGSSFVRQPHHNPTESNRYESANERQIPASAIQRRR